MTQGRWRLGSGWRLVLVALPDLDAGDDNVLILDFGPDNVDLVLGTATQLTALTAAGGQFVDLLHLGVFLNKYNDELLRRPKAPSFHRPTPSYFLASPLPDLTTPAGAKRHINIRSIPAETARPGQCLSPGRRACN